MYRPDVILNKINTPVSHWTRDLVCTYANNAFNSFYGISPESLVGQRLSSILGEAAFRKLTEDLNAVLSGEERTFERVILSDDKPVRHVVVNFFPDVNHQQVSGFYASVTDITEVKSEQEKKETLQSLLEISSQNFDSIIRSLGKTTLISKTDRLGRIMYVSPKFCEISGFSEAELIGKDHRVLNSSFHSKDFFRDLWETLLEGRSWSGEICNKKKDGEKYWVDTVICPILNVDGSPKEFITVRFDVSEKKEAQKRMIIASKLETLGEISASIAHEVNQPLAIIAGKLHVLQKKLASNCVEPEAWGKDLVVLEDMTDRISRIIQGLKNFSRTRDEDERSLHEVASIVEDTLILFNQRVVRSGIRFSSEIPPGVVVNCNATQISQVLLNLLNNAIDAVQTELEPWIQLGAEILPNSWLRLAVVDSGNGIPEAIAKNLMTPFFTTKPQGQGTGLGLTISRKIIEAHGGRFYLDPTGPNTQFVVELPAVGKS